MRIIDKKPFICYSQGCYSPSNVPQPPILLIGKLAERCKMPKSHKILFFLKLYRLLPAYLIWKCSKNKNLIRQDMYFWKKIRRISINNDFVLYGYLLLETEAFRNIVLMRLNHASPMSGFFFKLFFRPFKTLYLGTAQVGAGLYIQHGFSTIVAAKSVGEECWINQQVTIGFEQERQPVIGNHVRICAGAIIVGDVTIGDNSIVAAGAVVTHDIPPGEIWGGVPAKFIKKVKGSSFDDQSD